MKFKKFKDKYVVRLERGEDIVLSLKTLAQEEKIKLGTVAGIGAVGEATLGLFDTGTKEYHSRDYHGMFELVSLSGTVSTMDGAAYLHLHAIIADRDGQTFGGHLNKAVISATGEIVIERIDGLVDRKFSEEIGLNLFDL